MASKIGRYTAVECARILKCSRSTFYRWLKDGKIEVGKIDGRYRASDVVKALIKLETA